METPRKANRFMFFLMICMICVSFILAVIGEKTSILKTNLPIVYFLYYAAVTVIPIFLFMRVTKIPLTYLIPIKKLKWKNTLLIVLISIAIQPILSLVSAVTSLFFENKVGDMMSTMSQHGYVTMILVVAVLPAICEEILFRGIILTGYKKVGIEKAAIVTGLFFAIMHMNEHQFFYALLMGIIFAYFVYYTNSIFSSILSHFIINSSQITAVYLANIFYPQQIGNNVTLDISDKLAMIQESAYTAIVFIPVLVGLLMLFIMTNKKLKLDMIDHIMKHSKLIVINPEPKYDTRIFTVSFWLTVILFIFIVAFHYFE